MAVCVHDYSMIMHARHRNLVTGKSPGYEPLFVSSCMEVHRLLEAGVGCRAVQQGGAVLAGWAVAGAGNNGPMAYLTGKEGGI